ncbi:EF-hand domain-containing protein [uncultured Thiodictyon sp.]|uniref:EF-hand domain-containing protein n=1 Tax=uncultured Thiodictyon sp. TaxID=1846217 RepID=UPI0025E7D0D5|nr:EF-hand domain-containing protein [uncultured Thiodictyon sp.]
MNTRRHQTRAITRGLTLALACVLLPGALLAQAPAAPGPMSFADMDKNGDGIVTGPEFATGHAAHMAARAAQGAPTPGAATAAIFADFDQNGDGQLTPEEFQAGRQARMQGRPGMGGGMGGGPGRGMGMGRGMPAFAEFDLNGDGTLTEAEFTQARAKRMAERAAQGYPMRNAGKAPAFSTIDTDGNGRVTPEEFAAGQAAHRQQMMTQP